MVHLMPIRDDLDDYVAQLMSFLDIETINNHQYEKFHEFAQDACNLIN